MTAERRAHNRQLKPRERLGRRLAVSSSLWALIALLAVSLLNFLFIYPQAKDSIVTSLKQEMQITLASAEVLFERVADNADILSEQFLTEYELIVRSKSVNGTFDRWFEETSPGVMRLKQAYFDGTMINDKTKVEGISAFVGLSDAPLDRERKARLLAATLTLNRLGPAWSRMSSNSHLSMPENALAIFSEDTPWGRMVDKDLIMTDYSVLRSASQAENPRRLPNWTGLYYDESADAWTVTYQRPIDQAGKHLATASFDVQLDQLLADLKMIQQADSEYLVMNADGDLIVGSDIDSKLASQRMQNATDVDDPTHRAIYALTQSPAAKRSATVFDDVVPGRIVILHYLPRLNWWYATLYPRELILKAAMGEPLRLSLIGLLVLGIFLLVVYWRVSREVAEPLERLTLVAGLMDSSNYSQVISDPDDHQWAFKGEVRLALDAFRTMARRFVDAQVTLEQQVVERTQALAVANQQLQDLADRDGLTGLMNRRSFDRDLANAVAIGEPHVLAMADIDSFKAFNDCYGHEAGDRVMRSISAVLSEQPDIDVYRYGGEEFAILLKLETLKEAPDVLSELVGSVTALNIPHAESHRESDVVSISMGVAVIDGGIEPSEAIQRADKALYRAKRLGGNRLELAGPLLAE